MKLIVPKSRMKINPAHFLRTAGYIYIEDRRMNKTSFARPLNNGFYPRFHLYLEEDENRFIFNLHLDQKKASYSGQTMHSGEYDGDLVEGELVRLKNLL